MASTSPNLSELAPIDDLHGDSIEDTEFLRKMAEQARQFLCTQRWCGEILQGWFGFGVGALLGVFLFRIRPTEPGVDDLLWVVVGDVPPAYLVTDDAGTPREALRAYVDEMSRWVDAVRSGEGLDRVIPVNAPPTTANADSLARRLDFIRRELLHEDRESPNRG